MKLVRGQEKKRFMNIRRLKGELISTSNYLKGECSDEVLVSFLWW